MASVADLECLRNWRRGDVHAGLDLVSRHVPELRRFVRRRLRRDIEDVVQQTLVIFLEKGPQFRADSSVTTFLLGIARNLVYAELRRRIKIEPRAEIDTQTEDPPIEESWLTLETSLRDLTGAIAELAPELEQILRLVYFERLTMAAAAKRLRLPSGTVASRIRRAKATLRRKLEARQELARD